MLYLTRFTLPLKMIYCAQKRLLLFAAFRFSLVVPLLVPCSLVVTFYSLYSDMKRHVVSLFVGKCDATAR